MTTNKTPIQEFIDYCVRNRFDCTQEDGFKFEALDFEDTSAELMEYKQKEKAFAFDCYMRGYNTADDRLPADFDFFYSQYA